jgi:hypothetical protein
MSLQDSQDYKEWVLADIERGGKLVFESPIYAPNDEYNSLVSVVLRKGQYTIYRTTGNNAQAAVSVDSRDVCAEMVFDALFNRYSRRFA